MRTGNSVTRSERGNAALVFLLGLIPLAGAAGVAVDVTRIAHTKADLQVALDGSALAAAALENGSDAAREASGRLFLASGLEEPCLQGVSFTFSSGRVDVRGSCRVRTTMLSLLGTGEVVVTQESAAGWGGGRGIELAIVVDVSGSMAGDIPHLRQATAGIITRIFAGDPTGSRSRVSIIPFSGRVNLVSYGGSWFRPGEIPGTAGAPADGSGAFASVGVWGVGGTSADTRCKISGYTPASPRLCGARRPGDAQWNDSPPSAGALELYEGDAVTCPAPRAQGLTNRRDVLLEIAGRLCAGHGTSTHEGMAWGWRAVSPRWKGLWGDPDLPLSHAATPGKAVIIMTDGRNHPDQAGAPISEAGADAELLRTCAAMRAEGITIHAITYNMNGALSALYRQCTTRPEYEISAESGEELVAAFNTIGTQLSVSEVRLLQ